MTTPFTYVAFLRGINVGGNKTVPMAELSKLFESLGFTRIKTILNTGNVVFEVEEGKPSKLVKTIETAIAERFGFSVPTQVWRMDDIRAAVASEPFKAFKPDPDSHWYATFLNNAPNTLPQDPIPGVQLLGVDHQILFSVLSRSAAKSTDFMSYLDRHFGKMVTTRNWNTVEKILKARD